jgi:cohesin loading factor subunit SCC2
LKIVINKPSTPSKSHTLQSSSKTDEAALDKFTDYIQDIVDAEHALLASLGMHIDGEENEEHDEARDEMIFRYFYVPDAGGRYATLQPGTIAKLLRLLNPCIKSPNGRRLLEEAMFQDPEEPSLSSQSRGSSKKRAGKERQRERQESDLVAQLQSVLKLLERSAAQVEGMKILPGELAELGGGGGKSDGYVSPAKKTAAKKGGKAKANGTGNGKKASKSPSVASSPVKPRRSSRSATPSQDYEEEELEDEEGKSDDEDEEEETMSSPMKGKGGRKSKKGSATPTQKTTVAKGKKKKADGADDEAKEWSDATIEQFYENLETFGDGLYAIEAALSILTAGKLPKKVRKFKLTVFEHVHRLTLSFEMQLYSEDLITSCLNTLKKQLPLAIYPSLDADNSAMSTPLADKRISKLIKDILQKVPVIFSLITLLLKQEELPEAIIINGVYLAIAPFFVEQGLKSKSKDAGFGNAETKVIRNEALATIKLVRLSFTFTGLEAPILNRVILWGHQIFSKYANQRQWILEEVLSSITKLPDISKRKPQYLLVVRQESRRARLTKLSIQFIEWPIYPNCLGAPPPFGSKWLCGSVRSSTNSS